MVPRAKTYFLAPGWDLQEGSVQLGSIITNPLRPQLAIFKPPLEEIDSRIHVSGRDEFTSTIDTSENGTPALFSTFLSLFGLGDEPSFHYDRKHVLSYSFRKLHMRWFRPSDALKRKAVIETDRVAQFCRAGNYKIPVYMVTGLKTISGAGVTTTSSRGNGWRVRLSVGASSTDSAEHAEAELEEPEPIVFAFQLTELRLSPDGEIASANFLDESQPTDPGQSAADLQKRLDKELGETAFTIVLCQDTITITRQPEIVVCVHNNIHQKRSSPNSQGLVSALQRGDWTNSSKSGWRRQPNSIEPGEHVLAWHMGIRVVWPHRQSDFLLLKAGRTRPTQTAYRQLLRI
ncbi:hypothetical protein B0T25DRAFT_366964 [Lasiosphaeria hispida]|uniref:Uncharacterized protein n=1 Tax=Lasiosphaeria hispida TaxID=260671 RepID=A0AAJ0H5Q4_9PEZI|nr:hypothetical protein B0T25DRAFT_366964 [Lasiosphaeria hispida]